MIDRIGFGDGGYLFELHGMPTPQKQTRFRCVNGKPLAYDPSSTDKERMRWQIKPFAPKTPINGPVELSIMFFFPIPKSASKSLRRQMINRIVLPDKRPDEDNLAYLVTNALKGIVYDDDSRVCAKHVYKFYGPEPKTVIRVRPIHTLEAIGFQDECG